MASSALNKILKTFTGPPVGPVPNLGDWETVEKSIGRLVPEDFKRIVEHTGGCRMGHCVPRNPAEHKNIGAALSHAALNREFILKGELAREMLNIELYPEPGGWIQLAGFDRKDFMLKPTGDDIAIADFSGWEVFRSGLTFSELMWAIFKDRKLYDGVGATNWHDSDQFFGW